METRKPAMLSVKLGANEIKFVEDLLRNIQSLALSANDLLEQIRTKSFSSKTMNAIFKMLTLEEHPVTQTYKDPGNNNHMTIAVGLDIQPPHHSDAKAVILSVNSHWDFEDMQKNINRPT